MKTECRSCHRLLPPLPEGLTPLQRQEKRFFIRALKRYDRNISSIAQECRLSRPTVYKKLRQYGLWRAKKG